MHKILISLENVPCVEIVCLSTFVWFGGGGGGFSFVFLFFYYNQSSNLSTEQAFIFTVRQGCLHHLFSKASMPKGKPT